MDPILALCLIALIVLVALFVAHKLFPAQVNAVEDRIPVFRTVEGAIYRAGEGTVDEFADYVDKLNPNPAPAGPAAPVDQPVVAVAVPAAVPTSAPTAPAV